jgi:hypothetical protein
MRTDFTAASTSKPTESHIFNKPYSHEGWPVWAIVAVFQPRATRMLYDAVHPFPAINNRSNDCIVFTKTAGKKQAASAARTSSSLHPYPASKHVNSLNTSTIRAHQGTNDQFITTNKHDTRKRCRSDPNSKRYHKTCTPQRSSYRVLHRMLAVS